MPVLYNARRRFELPLPSLNLPNIQHSDSLVQREPNDIQIVVEPEIETEIEPIADQLGDQNNSENENSGVFQEEHEVQESPAEFDLQADNVDETKDIMPNVELDEVDSFAVSSVFDEEQDNTSLNTPVLASDEITFFEEGVLKIRMVFDDDCEMVSTFGAKPTPYIGFEVKANDAVSMNIPFKENVSQF